MSSLLHIASNSTRTGKRCGRKSLTTKLRIIKRLCGLVDKNSFSTEHFWVTAYVKVYLVYYYTLIWVKILVRSYKLIIALSSPYCTCIMSKFIFFIHVIAMLYHVISKHCMKSVCIRSYCGPHFPTLVLNTERSSVSLRIQSECGKMPTRITPNTDTFYVVKVFCRRAGQASLLMFAIELKVLPVMLSLLGINSDVVSQKSLIILKLCNNVLWR